MFANKIVLILASLGLFQSILFSFYLFTLKKGNRKANLFLAFMLLGLTIRVAKSVINYYVPLEAWQRNIGISGIFIVGPCLWLYFISLTKKDKPFTFKQFSHFLPFFVFILLLKIIPSNGKFENYWNYGIVVFHLMIYFVISINYLFKNQNTIPPTIFKWSKNILIGIILIWLYYTSNFLNFRLYYITGPIFYTFLIYAFSYLFLNRSNFNLEKYSSSNIDRVLSKSIFEKINHYGLEVHSFHSD